MDVLEYLKTLPDDLRARAFLVFAGREILLIRERGRLLSCFAGRPR